MSRRSVVGILAALCAVLLLAVVVPLLLAGTRPDGVNQGLDFLHTRQVTGGGFSPNTATADVVGTQWAILAISAGQESPVKWKTSGKDPITYLQSLNLQSLATTLADANGRKNPPAFYAKCILAYKAAGRLGLAYAAGTPPIVLTQQLNGYRSNLGVYFPETVDGVQRDAYATTAWAILALKAAGETGSGLDASVAWLKTQANGDHGFGRQFGATSDVHDTSVCVLALLAGGVGANAQVITDAISYLHLQQNSDGGFHFDVAVDYSDTESTSWAVQALNASGIDPNSWRRGATPPYKTPITYLHARQLRGGSFEFRSGLKTNPLTITSEAVIALSKRHFPYGLAGDLHPVKFRPVFTSFKPGGGSVFHKRSVDVRATYHDEPTNNGTGINAAAIHLTIDGKNRTGAASITASKLALDLKNVPNGAHTITIKLADYAGNTSSATHKFTVNVSTPTPTPTPTATSTHSPLPSHTPSVRPSYTYHPTTTPPGGATLYPSSSSSTYPSTYPTTSMSPSVSPSTSGTLGPPGYPSSVGSGSPSPSGGTGNNGLNGTDWGPIAIGVGLAAVVGIGVLASYLSRRRLARQLGAAAGGTATAPSVADATRMSWLQKMRHTVSRGRSTPGA